MSLEHRNDAPTRPSLLLQLRDAQDAQAWEQFVEVYAPLIHGFCRGRGLQEADAADVAQEVLRGVAQAIRKFEYTPARGRFRNWLLTVVRSKFNNFLAQQRRRPEPAGASTLEALIDRQAAEVESSEWEAEYHRWLLHWAARRIRGEFSDSTWQAFWRTAIEGCDGKEVSEALGLSIGAVYVAKSRVVARLRAEILSIDGETAGPWDVPSGDTFPGGPG